ncbi:glycine amidinotransferase [bacterium]|nr:glycine amidinotransferase [bacterium]
MSCLVNSYDEWSPLEEVIVGDGLPPGLPALDFSFRVFFHDNIYEKNRFEENSHQYITKRHVEEHKEDLENFADILKELGITVRRPKVPNLVHRVKTPNWESTIHPSLNVRDLTLIVGETIIETPPICRWRYFETDYLKHLFLEYFQSGAKWVQAPRPLLLDHSFDLSYFGDDSKDYEMLRAQDYNRMNHGYEIMFDAANCLRLGDHILMNVSCENHRLGAKWLQSQLGEKFKIITVEWTDSHIDSTFLPVRPGLGIIMRPDVKLPSIFDDWDIIYIPMRNRSEDEYDKQGINLASPRIELNFLSISPELIICHEQYEEALSLALKKYKVEVISCPIRHCELFSGAHHCLTLDVRRKGGLESYFS